MSKYGDIRDQLYYKMLASTRLTKRALIRLTRRASNIPNPVYYTVVITNMDQTARSLKNNTT